MHDRKELGPAIDLAAGFDRKIVVEQAVGGRGNRAKMGKARELEVAVLGNDEPIASVVGEIVPGKEFYDYEAKYLSEGSQAIIPAKLTKQQSSKCRRWRSMPFAPVTALVWRGWTFSSRRASRTALPERDQHHAGLYFDQHVSQALGGVRHEVSRSDFAADRAGAGTQGGTGTDLLLPRADIVAVGISGKLCLEARSIYAMTLLDAPTYDPAKARKRKNILIAEPHCRAGARGLCSGSSGTGRKSTA